MSSGVGVWRQAFARASRAYASAVPAGITAENAVAGCSADPFLASFVQQLFLFSGTPRRKCILFAGAGKEILISGLCERIGRTLAGISGRKVALVSGADPARSGTDTHRQRAGIPPAMFGPPAIQLGENFWSVPVEVFQAELESHLEEKRTALPFDHVILGANINDSIAPLLCKSCDGAVLVISANQTRREAALRAKEILVGANVELLGALLDNRTFPVPEPIYRRL